MTVMVSFDVLLHRYRAKSTIHSWAAVFVLLYVVWAVPCVSAGTYFVATNGFDTNPGTLLQPFQTLQRAANIMVAGDTCFVRGGVYRETLTPTRSGTSNAPITYTAYNNEVVTVSAADVIPGWTPYVGNIYQAPMNWTLGDGFNQVFVDGEMVFQARYPNTGSDPMHPTLADLSATSNSVSCAGLTQTNDFWKGGIFVGGMGYRWTFQCAMITSSVPGSVFISQTSNPWFTGAGQGFVTGVLGALDAAGEWHFENSTLFLWPPASENPAGHLVEAKRRAWCIDFNQKSWIAVQGLQLFGGSVRFAATNCVLQNCTARYLSHFTRFTWSGYNADGGVYQGHNGIHVIGNNNVISNCTLRLSAGSAIVLRGASNLVTRCSIFDIDYSGTYSCPLTVMSGGGNRVWFNTMHDAGRDIIHPFALDGDDFRYNDLSRAGLLCYDLGVIYQWGVDGKGTRYAYNWVHDNFSTNDRLRPGIYIDNWCRNIVVDHNVVWNCNRDAGIRVSGPATNHHVYNNTLFDCDDVGSHRHDQWPSPNPDPAFWTSDTYTYAASNNLFLDTNATSQLVGPAALDFRLMPAAPALNAAAVIPVYTDGYCGPAPDLGAYELGLMPWTAGTNGVAVPVLDSLGDGIPDGWRERFFGGDGKSTNALSCASCDSDGDGAINRFEYFAGTDPMEMNDVFRLSAASGGISQRGVRFPTASYLFYRVETNGGLKTGSWTVMTNGIAGTGETVQILDTIGTPQTTRFYRAKIVH